MTMLSLDEFESILSEFEWALAIEQFLTTDWTSSAPSEPNRPSWVLGIHILSSEASFHPPLQQRWLGRLLPSFCLIVCTIRYKRWSLLL